MENESLGKALPRLLFPYVQQWAESSGSELLSRLLVDEQFLGLVDKYADDIVTIMVTRKPGNGNGHANGNRRRRVHETDADADDLASLNDRVVALEAQQEMQQALFETIRIKIQPLALALGCCPECVVGIDGCPKCGGLGTVGYYPPDYALLEEQVVSPLVKRGVPLNLKVEKVPSTGRQSKETPTNRKATTTSQKEEKHVRRNDRRL
ncbi:MAG: hypothetical protein WBD27_07090 [Pyrinomonadaceae bacterium]